MGYRQGSRSFPEELGYEWLSATRKVRERKRAYVIGFLAVSFLFALISSVAVRPSLEESPILLLAGFLHSLRLLSVLAFVWFWVVAYLVHRAVLNWAEGRWIDRERKNKPGESFPVPYWRFRVFAFLPAAITFLVPTLVVGYLLFILPSNFPVLDHALSIFVSAEE